MKLAQGQVALITVIMITFALIGAGVVYNLSSLSNLQRAFQLSLSTQAFYLADGCLEEGLLRLRRDINYPGGNLSIGDGNCTIAITGSGNLKTVTVVGTVSNLVRKLQATVDASNQAAVLKTWQQIQ